MLLLAAEAFKDEAREPRKTGCGGGAGGIGSDPPFVPLFLSYLFGFARGFRRCVFLFVTQHAKGAPLLWLAFVAPVPLLRSRPTIRTFVSCPKRKETSSLICSLSLSILARSFVSSFFSPFFLPDSFPPFSLDGGYAVDSRLSRVSTSAVATLFPLGRASNYR